MKRPFSVLAAIGFQVVQITGLITTISRKLDALEYAKLVVPAVLLGLCVFGLYGLLQKTPWARLFNAAFLGVAALFGCAFFLLAMPVAAAVPGLLILALYAWLAAALAFGKAAKRYFAGTGLEDMIARGAV